MNKESTKTSSLVEVTPIHDFECERVVLASIISSCNTFAECDKFLHEDCFYDLHHREIFLAAKNVFVSGDTLSLISVNAELKRNDSTVTLIELTEILTQSEIQYYCDSLALRLNELSYRRKLWEIGVKLMENSCKEHIPLETIHNDAKNGIDNLFENISGNIEKLSDVYQNLQEHMLINRNREPGSIFGTPTGFEHFDRNGGLVGNDFIVIGADTSQGKTSLATAMAVSAIMNGDGVAFYSMEMTPQQVAARIASMQSGISSKDIMMNPLELADIYRIDDAMYKLDMGNLYFDGRSTSSLDSIISSIRQLKMKHDIKGVVVDYIQLINARDSKNVLTREQEVGKIARDLKNLAKELDIWIIGLSQLARGEKSNPVPMMSMLRDSGQIEHAADVVILIYRPVNGRSFPAPYSNVPTGGKALIKVEKGRNIGVGEFLCGFDAPTTRFYPLSELELRMIETGTEHAVSMSGISSESSIKEEIPF